MNRFVSTALVGVLFAAAPALADEISFSRQVTPVLYQLAGPLELRLVPGPRAAPNANG